MKNSLLLPAMFAVFLCLSGCAASQGMSPHGTAIVGSLGMETPTLLIPAQPSQIPTVSNTQTSEPATPTLAPTTTPSLEVHLYAVGDLMLARSVGQQVLEKGPSVVFAGVQSILDAADVLLGNLECSLTAGGQAQPKLYSFAAPPETAQALALAGFDAVSLANNHSMDFGAQGLADTRRNLENNGVSTIGAGADAAEAYAPVILERNGLRLAILAYVDVPRELYGFNAQSWIATENQPGVAWASLQQINNDVASASEKADLVIVMLHSGIEITPQYIPNISEEQMTEARAAIDAGATVVIGSHPHVLQRIERYHGGLIAYSLGNFIFDEYLGIANESVILRVMLGSSGVQSYDTVPILIQDGLPVLLTGEPVHTIETLVAP